MSLPTLPDVTQLTPNVTRILGGNPGKYTLQGTNTYLIHHPSQPHSLILLDTAQSFPTYIPLLSPFLSTSITSLTILLSHWHADHVDGLPSVVELAKEKGVGEVRVWKFLEGGSGERDEGVEGLLKGEMRGWVRRAEEGRGLTEEGVIGRLREGEKIRLGEGEGEGVELEVIHTPGHTTDSISLLLRSTPSPSPSMSSDNDSDSAPILFTFDTVLGHGTAVFENLGTYMSSLRRCLDAIDRVTVEGGKVRLFPGHGEVIEDGKEKLEEYLRHRQLREDQVVEKLVLAREGEEQGRRLTADELTEQIYASTIPDSLKQAAARGLLLHLEKLQSEGKVERKKVEKVEGEPLEGWYDLWRLVDGSEGEEVAKGGAKF